MGPEGLGGLANLGAVGIILLWFMLRAERLLAEVARSVNRMAVAHALEVATRPDAPEVVKQQAKAIIEDVQRKESGGAQVAGLAGPLTGGTL